MRDKITQRTLEAARKRGKAGYLWDTELRGFGAYATAEGSVSWLVQRWIGGRSGKAIRFAFDHYPRLSIDDARTQASSLLGDIAKGIDVVGRRRKERQGFADHANGAQLLDTWKRYHKKHAKPGRHWQETDQLLKRHVIPALGERTLLSDISKQDVRALIDAKEDAGKRSAARVLFAALNPFLKWCVERDYLAVSPMADLSAPAPSASRDRYLNPSEIKSFWQASDTLGYPFCQFYRLCLLTGQRREEVAAMQWKELLEDVWTIPAERTKNGKEHIVHLSKQALAVLASIERVPDAATLPDAMAFSPYVFTTTGETSISGFAKAKATLDKAMSITNPWRVHDLRRTLTSTLAEIGISADVADRILNHVSGTKAGVKGVYQRYEFLPERKRALEAWGRHVEALVNPKAKSSGKVVSLR